MNYSVIMILLNIVAIVFWYIRKKMVGNIIEIASLSKTRYFYLVLGCFFIIILGFGNLYSLTSIKGDLSNLEISTITTLVLAGIFFIIMFFTSKLYIGLKGVSIPILPYFISKDEITDCNFSLNTLILKRTGKKDFKIKIEINDVKGIESAIVVMSPLVKTRF